MTVHDELRALLQRYARAADDRDLDALRALFHPDAVIDGVNGVLGLDGWLETMARPKTFPVSMHMMGEPLVDIGTDADADSPNGAAGAAADGTVRRASMDTYAVVHQLGDRAAGQGDLTLGMRYLDEAVLEDGRWVFWRRKTATLWMR